MVRVQASHSPQLKALASDFHRVDSKDQLALVHWTDEPHAGQRDGGRPPGRPPELSIGIEGSEVQSVVDYHLTPAESYKSFRDVGQPSDSPGDVELARTLPPPPERMPLLQLSRKVDDTRPYMVIEEDAVASGGQSTVGSDPLFLGSHTIRVGFSVRLGEPTCIGGKHSARNRRNLAMPRRARTGQGRGHHQRSCYRHRRCNRGGRTRFTQRGALVVTVVVVVVTDDLLVVVVIELGAAERPMPRPRRLHPWPDPPGRMCVAYHNLHSRKTWCRKDTRLPPLQRQGAVRGHAIPDRSPLPPFGV